MSREHHIPLVHPRLVRERVASLPPGIFARHEPGIAVWLGHLQSGALDATKEVSLQGGFLERVFGDMLGYSTMATARTGEWELVAEKSVQSGGQADGALGFFSQSTSRIVAPIELKGAAQFLDHAKGRALTPIQQGWDYANKTPHSRWVIVSNYRETRLYSKSHGQAAYELFRLEDLASEAGFLRFVALLGRDAILGGPNPSRSPLSELVLASERTEREITAKLYQEFRTLRARLFEQLCRTHPNILPTTLLGHAQTILDRVLFAAFAEDRGLIPRNTLARAYEHRDPYNPHPVWQNFLAVFRSIDAGNPSLGIPAYNGGLFREVPELDGLEVSDEACRAFKALGEYDFAEDVSVDVLGHIFEQSITDLEDLRQEAEMLDAPTALATTNQKRPSTRKREGIFYTPPFVTSFLVRETLGLAVSEAWDRAEAGRGSTKKDRIATWEAYQAELRQLRVLDPACGSGAFLVAAFDLLAHEFERANRSLAELRGQQASLFDLTRTVLNENLYGIDKSGESVEIAKLSLWLKTAEYGRRLTFLDRNIRQGNSVVSDDMLDPWAFDWNAGQVVRSFLEPEVESGPDAEGATLVEARWREGFDVVIGNPPYVRQELLTAYKEHWRQSFRAFDGTADLFVYFFERGLQRLKPGGRLGFIVSNKWLRGGYAEKLRALFARECTIETLVDFGHAPVFPDADAFPCIITLRKHAAPPEHAVRVTLYPRDELGKEHLASYVDTHRFALPQRQLSGTGWTLEPPEIREFLEKLRRNGTPLGEYARTKPYYGIKTGCNEAFLVDQATKDRLCREDPRSAEILKKYLRGQDIARWSPQWSGLWMIFARRGIDIERYPAVMAHLQQHRTALEPRPRDFAGKGWPGRKPGNYKWYEIQDAVDYHEMFEGPKLVYPDILWSAQFSATPAGFYVNNTSYLIPANDPWLVASLNSPALWSYLWRTAQHAKDEALRMFGEYVLQLPIPIATPDQVEAATMAVDSITRLTREARDAELAVLDLLRVEYGVGTTGRMLDDFSTLGSDAFVREVVKRRPKSAGRLTAAGLKELRAFYDAEAPAVVGKRAHILTLEREIAKAVHAAWGLTDADLSLLRQTAPPRMPPGW
jgi:type I restriction-modification system DNA methylase subunit